MKKIIIITILTLSIAGCGGQDVSKNIKLILPDSIYHFFPNYNKKYKNLKILALSTKGEVSTIPYDPVEFEVCYFSKIYKSNDLNSLTHLVSEYKSLSLNKTISGSRNYFIIGTESDMLKLYDSVSLKREYQIYKNSNLILNFHEVFDKFQPLYDSTTICGLPKGYEILILKSGNHYVLPEKYKTEWALLPEEIKHGYRSGVAYKEGEPYIVYWAVAW